MLNKKELLILSHFRDNARKSMTKISRNTGIPVSTIFDKLKLYEKDIIKKHSALLDFGKLGYDIRVKIALKTAISRRNELVDFLKMHGSVNSVFRINNGGDFLIEGVFKNMRDLQDFSEELEKFDIKQKHEYFVLEDIKREGFLADPDLVRFSM